jgi:dihydrofolate synthase / folylpolyglutamate synthase
VPIERPESNLLSEWLIYIDSINAKSIELGLDRVRRVKESCNLNPNFPVIIVAGTNGKGSSCKLLESILFEAGYKVGCYTSPHIYSFNERICINKTSLEEDLIVSSIKFIDENRNNIPLTYFEITTLAAMNLMIKSNVDIAILEVGLGGRYDAVNVFEPQISLLTSVGIDHQDYLGDTLEEIGYQKAGIFRSNKDAIVNLDNPPSSVLGYAEEIKANVSIKGIDFRVERKKDSFDYFGSGTHIADLPYPYLLGAHQIDNATGVLRCIELLPQHFNIKKKSIENGLVSCELPGRIEIIAQHPMVLADVSHNPEASLKLFNFLSEFKNNGKVYAVFSILSDKNIEGVIAPFLNLVDEWFIATINSSRARPAGEIQQSIKNEKPDAVIHIKDNLKEAYQNAFEKSLLNDNIVLFGSFYTVSECLTKINTNG